MIIPHHSSCAAAAAAADSLLCGCGYALQVFALQCTPPSVATSSTTVCRHTLDTSKVHRFTFPSHPLAWVFTSRNTSSSLAPGSPDFKVGGWAGTEQVWMALGGHRGGGQIGSWWASGQRRSSLATGPPTQNHSSPPPKPRAQLALWNLYFSSFWLFLVHSAFKYSQICPK